MVESPIPRPYWTPNVPAVRLTEQERTNYREQIRELVADTSLTFTWLVRQLSDEGLMTDRYGMPVTLSGVHTGEKADEILRRSLDILHRHQIRVGSCGES